MLKLKLARRRVSPRMAMTELVDTGSRRRMMLVLRPAAAMRRVEEFSSAKRPREAFRLLSRLARRHVPAAQLRLARLYLDGVEVPGSRQDAILWCEKAAHAGLVDAQCLLAALYLSGPTNPSSYSLFGKGLAHATSGPDVDLAFRWASRAAACGSADAKAILAHLHVHGPDTLRDPDRSKRLYRESAEQGSSKGAFGYGMLLMQQTTDAATHEQAVRWIRTAADADVPFANYIYAYILEHGIELPVDQVEAATFYKRSAERGVLQGQLRWGKLLIEGQHVTRNAVEGESWLRKAALAGEPEAASILGDLHVRDVELPPNFFEAAIWYRHAAERAHVVAAFKLAQLLVHDRPSLRQDLDEAIVWYCSAADGGHQPARTELVRLLLTGASAAHVGRIRTWFENKGQAGDQQAAFHLGLSFLAGSEDKQDAEEAVFWLRRAAETVVEAQYWYGYMLTAGRGVTADLHAGRKWIMRAADAGLQDAKVLLAEMMLNGRGGACDREAAFRLFKGAAEAGHPGAAFATGMILKGGYGVTADQAGAQAWLKEAATRGHVHAREMVEL